VNKNNANINKMPNSKIINMYPNSTICAAATPSGSGALAVIRISGPETFALTDKIFRAPGKNKKFSEQAANTVHFGRIYEGSELIDEVLISVFKAPKSYTGEDLAEISCHGSMYVRQKILNLLIKHGAEPAAPGEFTQRAFLNGKMDLSQAEAVADLIASETAAAHKVALQQLRGGFSKDLKNLRENLLHFISLIELELDFSEEDVEFADRRELNKLMDTINTKIEKLRDSFELGNAVKNGVPVAIIGEPNVGKSTLLNALLNEDKAIVSDIAGTTRDAVEDLMSINGMLFRFIDTAGIRQTTDRIENLGIEKTMDKIQKADIVLLLADAEKNNALKKIEEISEQTKGKKLVIVFNKTDRINNFKLPTPESLGVYKTAAISAKYKENIDSLLSILTDAVHYSKDRLNDTVVTNTRHLYALTVAAEAGERVKEALNAKLPVDLLSQDIREVIKHIGSITGEISADEVLSNIFKNFCIGK
jgi:tRNA modification GTPase